MSCKKCKLSSKSIWLALIIVIMIGAIVFVINNKNIISKLSCCAGKIPKLTEQPTDTRVANDVLPIHYWKIHSGIDTYFVPTEQFPIVDVLVTFNAGSARDQSLSGLSNMVMHLLKDQASINAGLDQDRMYFHLRSLSTKDTLNASLDLLCKTLNTFAPKDEDIQKVKQQILADLTKDNKDLQQIASNALYQIIYNTHPYTNVPKGTIEDIEKITKEDIMGFYKKYIVNKNVSITIVGSIHRDKAKEISELIAKKLNVGNHADPLPEVLQATAILEKTIAFPTEQAFSLVGKISLAANDPSYFPFVIATYTLKNRLSKELPDNNIDYTFHCWQKAGPFFIELTSNLGQSKQPIKELQKIMEDFVANGITEDELTAAKEYLIGNFPVQLDSNIEILHAVAKIGFYKMPYNYFDNYTHAIDKVTSDEVMNVIKNQLQFDQMVAVTVGEKS